MILIKLGGSVITDKSDVEVFREESVRNLAGVLSRFMKAYPDVSLVLGHGAGSFGHPAAKKFGTANGFHDAYGRLGACLVHDAVARLNRLVMKELLLANIPAMSFAPSGFTVNDKKNIVALFDDVLCGALEKGFLPVVYGDVIVDKTVGVSINSNEITLEYLAQSWTETKKYPVKTILMLSDRDGITDDRGEVVPVITRENQKEIFRFIHEPTVADVTGGMRHKLETALALADVGVQTLIINGNEPERFFSALKGAPCIGSLIKPMESKT